MSAQPATPRSTVATLTAGIALATLPACLTLIARRTHTPIHLISTLPIGEVHPLLVAAVPPALLWVWSPQLFRGVSRVPNRSVFGFTAILLLSASWFVTYSQEALAHTSVLITSAMIALTTLFLLLLALFRQSFGTSLTFHVVVAIWLSTVAFPSF